MYNELLAVQPPPLRRGTMFAIFVFTYVAGNPAHDAAEDWPWSDVRDLILYKLHLPGVECAFLPILKAEACTGEEAACKRIREAVERAQTEADAILFSHKPEEEEAIAEVLLASDVSFTKPVVMTSLGVLGVMGQPEPATVLNHLLLAVMLAPQLGGGLYKLENNRAVAVRKKADGASA